MEWLFEVFSDDEVEYVYRQFKTMFFIFIRFQDRTCITEALSACFMPSRMCLTWRATPTLRVDTY